MSDQEHDDDSLSAVSAGALAVIQRAEIDSEVATAHFYPRSLQRFTTTMQSLVTRSEEIATECVYSLPRDGKVIQGPSARFAEFLVYSFGNLRVATRILTDAGDFVTAQAVCRDLENGNTGTVEIQRRITDKKGRRFKADMIGVTANAASSIARRNAVLSMVPKALWVEFYNLARMTALGTVQTLPNRRAEAFKAFVAYGVSKEQIYATLGVGGEADVNQEQLLILRGILGRIKEGDTTPEEAFADADGGNGGRTPPVVPRKSDAPSGPTLGDAAQAVAGMTGESPVDVLNAATERARSTEGPAAGYDDGRVSADRPTEGMASGGERQLILSKVKSKRLDLLAVLDENHVTALQDPMTLAGLSSADFQRLKKALA